MVIYFAKYIESLLLDCYQGAKDSCRERSLDEHGLEFYLRFTKLVEVIESIFEGVVVIVGRN